MTDDAAAQPGQTAPDSTDDQAPAEQPAPEAAATEDDGGTSEAAKYRRRLRQTEQDRDQLAGHLDAMRRAEVTRLATTGEGPRLHAAGDVFADDYDLTEVLGEDGTVDPGKVRAAIEHHTNGRAHLRADYRQPRPDPSQGGAGRGGAEPASSGQGWAQALRGR